MSEKHFSIESISKLRNPKRIELLNPPEIVKTCLELSKLHSGTVLDIGTGTGLFAEHFFKASFNVTGIDDNETMITTAKEFVPQGQFIKASVENLPFEDRAFDISFLGHLFHEVENPIQVLNEVKRVTKKGLFILEWEYKNEEMGPPLKHRLSPKQMESYFIEATLDFHYLQINNSSLYYSLL